MFIKYIALILGALLSGQTIACEGVPDISSRDDVLIIVNDNAADACDLATYYANKRGLGKSNFLHIRTAVTPTIRQQDYDILLTQIKNGVNAYHAAGGQLRFLAMIRGLPVRVITDQPSMRDVLSIDGALKQDLGGDIYPARIDGLTLTAAKDLIDRTLEAENTGLSGKLISAASFYPDLGDERFSNADYEAVIEGPNLLSDNMVIYDNVILDSHQWRYGFGLFNESNPACTGNIVDEGNNAAAFYLLNGQTTTHQIDNESVYIGRAPAECRVQLVKGYLSGSYNEQIPGTSQSRIPEVINAAVYMGHLDGHSSLAGDFNNLKNWQKNHHCAAEYANLLCDDAQDADACRLASTDAYKEIDTRCYGVADGFIGHNMQSFPLSFYTAWPSYWRPLTIAGKSGSIRFLNESAGGGNYHYAYPLIKDDEGYDDNYSLWVGAHNRKPDTVCYDEDLNNTGSCIDESRLSIGQLVTEFQPLENLNEKKYYRLSMQYRSQNSDTGQNYIPEVSWLRAQLTVQDPNLDMDTGYDSHIALRSKALPDSYSDYLKFNNNGDIKAAVIGTNSGDWQSVSAEFVLDPVVILAGQNKTANAMSLVLFTNKTFSGLVGMDNIQLQEIDVDGNVKKDLRIDNASFDQGHKQFATGDWAATFTSRLNGVGFWGSTTHNEGGTAFAVDAGDSLMHLTKGKTLAEAVWSMETKTGGMLYADPLYSPMAIDIQASNNADYVIPQPYLPINKKLLLFASTINGRAAAASTYYEVSLCEGRDFYHCDADKNNWRLISDEKLAGGFENKEILNWMPDVEPGLYVIRLAVTNTALNGGTTMNSFYAFTIYRDLDDNDGDGINNHDELTLYGTSPDKQDSDANGFSDHEEARFPCLKGSHILSLNTIDNDKDGYTSIYELGFDGLNPCIDESLLDSDSNGINDLHEILLASGTYNLDADDDKDGLSNGDELYIHHTLPNKPDSNGNGFSDKLTVQFSCLSAPLDNHDGDRYDSNWEVANDLNPCLDQSRIDSDGDGYSDETEILKGSNPNNKNDYPKGNKGNIEHVIRLLILDEEE